ncbi:Hypothetical predicted protein [Cloeon dipterum]|uniref:G-protein coupled receptors family 2 profile 2 domain-containing protein n=1 Tax=Cloeon dipterum TaxID=197152 RepID=A0A8S1DTX8_9INSE|nr:Hypothetical predicted protein [Cloeon dipterum]
MEQTDNMGPIFTTAEDQSRIIELKRQECDIIINQTDLRQGHCPPVWDTIMCWPATPPGELAVLPCANYIAGFEYSGFASRLCTNESTWFANEHNDHWTNYSMCFNHPLATVVIKLADVANVSHTIEWMPILKPVVHVGFGFSLLSLLIAFGILATTKKLRCPRNTLHMHLFSSFILRAFMGLMKDTLFVEGLGLNSDIVVKGNDTFFSQQERNWACKSVTSLWQFALVANYSWILMEGLYLHNLIFLALFSDSSAITLHVVLGWGMPVLVVGIWVIVRTVFENDFCWTTQNTYASLVIRIPIIVSILINFVFFLNIIRVLFLKLKSCITEETRRYRYRKWAKSTLVLVPLFGVQYVFFLVLSCFIKDNPNVELFWLFADQISSSFQGFCVAVLYCFLNTEVRTELSKKWLRSPWHQKKGTGNRNGRNSSRGWRLRWSRSSYVTSNMSIECRRVANDHARRPAVCVPLCEETKRDVPKKCNCEDACECEEEAAVIEM